MSQLNSFVMYYKKLIRSVTRLNGAPWQAQFFQSPLDIFETKIMGT